MSLLEIESLSVSLAVGGGLRPIVEDATLSIGAGEAVGLVGESGSGKSMTVRSIAHLLPSGAVVGGDVRFEGRSVLELRGRELRRFRDRDIGVIFQDPRAHINPLRSIGDFLTESLMVNRGVGRTAAQARVAALLEEVGIGDARRRMRQHPYELSGGMLQRVMIASALASEPRLLLADEPTTALDVTTQSEVMAIVDELRGRRDLAMLFITHDLDLAVSVCDRIAVMYAGSVVEQRPAASLIAAPSHPYSAALLASRPSVVERVEHLAAIPGAPRAVFEAPAGCRFADRCTYAQAACGERLPDLVPHADGQVRCVRARDIALGRERVSTVRSAR